MLISLRYLRRPAIPPPLRFLSTASSFRANTPISPLHTYRPSIFSNVNTFSPISATPSTRRYCSSNQYTYNADKAAREARKLTATNAALEAYLTQELGAERAKRVIHALHSSRTSDEKQEVLDQIEKEDTLGTGEAILLFSILGLLVGCPIWFVISQEREASRLRTERWERIRKGEGDVFDEAAERWTTGLQLQLLPLSYRYPWYLWVR
jgi:hypothetical protein